MRGTDGKGVKLHSLDSIYRQNLKKLSLLGFPEKILGRYSHGKQHFRGKKDHGVQIYQNWEAQFQSALSFITFLLEKVAPTYKLNDVLHENGRIEICRH